MYALRDLVWYLLERKGIDYMYAPAYMDDMPMPRRKYFHPFYGTLGIQLMEQLMATIGQAQELIRQ